MKINRTLSYYAKNAKEFAQNTVSVDFSETQERFLKKLPEQAFILDFGCGSGRDAKYFADKGYRVEATDGSEELCQLASEYTGLPVKRQLFQELSEKEKYDGIWACSSILHLQERELEHVFHLMTEALKDEGIIYTSFKYGDFSGERNGRYFHDFTEKSLAEFLQKTGGLSIEEQWISGDVRPGREDEKWLNVIIRKSFQFKKFNHHRRVPVRIFVNASECSVIPLVEKLGVKYDIPVILSCEPDHVPRSKTSEIILAGSSFAENPDNKILHFCRKGDILCLENCGVAAVGLGKNCSVIQSSGLWCTKENIDDLLIYHKLLPGSISQESVRKIAGEGLDFEQSLEKMIIKARDEGKCR